MAEPTIARLSPDELTQALADAKFLRLNSGKVPPMMPHLPSLFSKLVLAYMQLSEVEQTQAPRLTPEQKEAVRVSDADAAKARAEAAHEAAARERAELEAELSGEGDRAPGGRAGTGPADEAIDAEPETPKPAPKGPHRFKGHHGT